jgi:hypothetical protein
MHMQCPQSPWLKKLSPRLKSPSPKLILPSPKLCHKARNASCPHFITHIKNLNHLQCNPSLQNSQPPLTVIQFIQTPHIIFIFSNIIIISKYSKVLKTTKTVIFNIQLVRILLNIIYVLQFYSI